MSKRSGDPNVKSHSIVVYLCPLSYAKHMYADKIPSYTYIVGNIKPKTANDTYGRLFEKEHEGDISKISFFKFYQKNRAFPSLHRRAASTYINVSKQMHKENVLW